MNDDAMKKLIEREERLTATLNNIDVGLLLQGPSAEIFLSNDKAFEMLGLTKDQLIGKTSFDPYWNVIHEDGSDFPGETHPVPEAIKTKCPIKDIIMGVYHPVKGDRVWLLVNAVPILNEDLSIKYVVCSFIDISKRKKAEEQLNKSHKELSILYKVYKNTTENLNLHELLNNAMLIIQEAFLIDGIAIYTITEASHNLTFEASLGFNEEIIKEIQIIKRGEGLAGRSIIIGNPLFTGYIDYPTGKFKSILVDDGFKSMGSIPMLIGNKAVGAISIAFKQEKSIDNDQLQLLVAVSRQIAIAVQNAQLVDSLRNELIERFRVEEAMLVANETISEKNQLLNDIMATLEIESKVDSLTGLYNRRYMLEKIKNQMINFITNGTIFSIVIADIDFYKAVNDTYGHDFGDYVLKTISEILKSNLGHADCVSRWGGDEFLFLLVNTNSEVSFASIELIRKIVAQTPFENDGKKTSLTMTFGIAVYSGNESIDNIIKRADSALYSGKRTTRNCINLAE